MSRMVCGLRGLRRENTLAIIATCVKPFLEVWSDWQGKYGVHSRMQTRTAHLIALVPQEVAYSESTPRKRVLY